MAASDARSASPQPTLETPPEHDPLRAVLKQRFGHDDFRPMQRAIILDALAGRDVLAVMPTGAGKSLCYQLPAIVQGRTAVVVSPLIALMADQVKALEANGVRATFLNSSIDAGQNSRREAQARQGGYELIYMAPERLMGPAGARLLAQIKLSLFAIDEAHCISEWGHDFRREYRQLGFLRERLADVPIMALTATATPRVTQDILAQLRLRDPCVYRGGFERTNLFYQVRPKQKMFDQVLAYLRDNPVAEGIVYCHSRAGADDLAARLQAERIHALPYHAGLTPQMRAAHQHEFIYGNARVMTATIAFGMGIDKPDVRFVIHADLPRHLEGYYQETGRAGRDGLPADCILFFSHADCAKIDRFIDQKEESQREQARAQLRRMVNFAYCTGCRCVPLLSYFGQDHPGNCGHCDNCRQPPVLADATEDARKLLSAVARTGQRFGLAHVIDVLRGQNNEKTQRYGHQGLSVYGVGAALPAAHWRRVAEALLLSGQLRQSGDEFPVLQFTPESMPVLRNEIKVQIVQPRALKPKVAARSAPSDLPCDETLFQYLRLLRLRLAQGQGVPPYVVFPDVALRHMAQAQPTSLEQFAHIRGVGEHKLKQYGQVFTEAIAQWRGESDTARS